MTSDSQAPRLMHPSGPSELSEFYSQTLLNDVIPFWFPRSIDPRHGGFWHCFAADGSLVDSDKSVWIQGRMSWMLLTLYNNWRPEPQWLAWGRQGVEFLMRHGFDTDGRMFFHLTESGAPIRKRRYAYSESFAAIACSALYRATREPLWREQAEKLFHQFVDWNFTPGRMPPKFHPTRPLTSLGPRLIALVTAQTLREDLGPAEFLTHWIDRCLDDIQQLFVKHERRAVLENVAPDGQIVDHFDGRILNPGHAIEAAWFVMEEGAYRGDRHWIDLGCQMLDYSWERGWDPDFGGLFYFRDLDHKPVSEYWQDMKFWWPHDEAIIACLLAFQLTGNQRYAVWHQLVHDWSFKHFADPVHGEWYGYLHRDGRLSTPLKGNLWKSFFHHPRMLWKAQQIASQLAGRVAPLTAD